MFVSLRDDTKVDGGEVIDARVVATSAHANQVRAEYDYRTALVGLKRALGMLAVPEDESKGLDQL